jgi:hypothetical protein
MDFSKEINECYDIIRPIVGQLNSGFSTKEEKKLTIIHEVTQLPFYLNKEVLEYSLEIIRPHQFAEVCDPDVIRNTFLLAAMTENKELFDAVLHKKRNLIYTYQVAHRNPEMKFFTRFGQMLPPANDFVQILHNVLCYQGLSNWLDQFMREEASSITGTYYLAAGKGTVSEIELNIKRWGNRITRTTMLKFASEYGGHQDVLEFLSRQN